MIATTTQYFSLLLGSSGIFIAFGTGMFLSYSTRKRYQLLPLPSLSFNSVNRTFKTGLNRGKAYNVKDFSITKVTEKGELIYVLQNKNENEKFILPVDSSVCKVNENLLYEIFSENNDQLVESVLLNDKHLLNFSCPMTSNPSNTLDTLLRKNYLKEKGQLSGEDINEKMMAISNEELKDYEEFKMNEIRNSSPSTLGMVEEFLHDRVEKAREITEFVRDQYNVSNLEQFKNLGVNEIVQIAKHLEISDVNSFYQKLKY